MANFRLCPRSETQSHAGGSEPKHSPTWRRASGRRLRRRSQLIPNTAPVIPDPVIPSTPSIERAIDFYETVVKSIKEAMLEPRNLQLLTDCPNEEFSLTTRRRKLNKINTIIKEIDNLHCKYVSALRERDELACRGYRLRINDLRDDYARLIKSERLIQSERKLSPKEEALRKQSLKKEALRKQSLKKEALRKQSPKKPAPRKHQGPRLRSSPSPLPPPPSPLPLPVPVPPYASLRRGAKKITSKTMLKQYGTKGTFSKSSSKKIPPSGGSLKS